MVVASVFLALLLTFLFVPTPISAADSPGITVTNAGIVATVSQGQVFTHTMNVSIGATTPATVVIVSVDGVAQAPDGTYILLDAASDTNPNTARPFITVNTNSFHLNPSQSQDVTATITVPQNASGGYFAVIRISNPPVITAGSNVAISTSVNVPVYLTIKDSQLTQTGKITGISTGDITNGKPVAITTTFQNTGNTYFKVWGQVSVTTDQGFILDTMPIPTTVSSILPAMSREFETDYIPGGTMLPGTYHISAKIMIQDGTVLDQSTSTFTIKAPYVPPPALGNVSLAPSGASTLQNTDGTISIYFPTGAAAIPVDISLNNYAAAQLPVAPTGFTFTGSCFQVNGLTGLLAKDATIIVKYTSDDLSKANGKAASLVLMRWDAGTNQWVTPRTKVDTKAMTLSASSNLMGIWAVAVGSATSSSGVNWIMIGIIAVVIVVISIVVVLLMARRKLKRKPAKS
jgi:hypothetical protein